MSVRRLLMVAQGGGAYAAAVPPAVFEVLAAPEGAWPGSYGGLPYFAAGQTIIPYTNASGDIKVAAFDNASSTVTGTFTLKTLSVDQHNRPAILRRSSDNKLVAVYCDHVGSALYRRISTNADDVSAWGTEGNLDASVGSTNYTYPNLMQLGDETDDPIYVFYRDNDGAGSNWCISKSTDGGSTWGILTNLTYGTRYYGMAHKASESRIDYVFSDGSYAEDGASLYHMYYEGGDYFTSDGTPMPGSPPFDITDMTLLYDGSSAGTRGPYDIQNDGAEIAVVFGAQTGTPHDHIGEDEDYLYARAAVGSASWTVETVAAGIGALTFEYTEGMLTIDPNDIEHLIVSRRETSDLGDPFHLYDYQRTGASTWTVSAVTSSGDPDLYPCFVRAYDSALEYVWLKGTFTSQSDFDTGIMGFGA